MLNRIEDMKVESHSIFHLGRHADFVILIQLVFQNLVQVWSSKNLGDRIPWNLINFCRVSRTHYRLRAPALQSGPSVAWSTPWFSPRFFTKPITAIRSAVYRSPKRLVSFCWSIILNLDISSGNESSGRVAGGYISPSYSIFRARNRVHFLYVCTRYPSLWDQGTTCDSLHCSCHCWQCELAIAKRLWRHRRVNRGECKCQLGLSWAFVALAAESADWVENGSKVSLFSFPVFIFFIFL